MEDAEDFCRQHWLPLARALAAYTGDALLGQDLAQESLARVLARWGRVRRMRSPGGYAYRVGVNLARDALRRQARSPALPMADQPVDDGDTVVRLVVADAVGALPERQRLAVSLRYLADLSVDQTAAAMRCRPGTVKALCHQATRALRASPELAWHGAAEPRTGSTPSPVAATAARNGTPPTSAPEAAAASGTEDSPTSDVAPASAAAAPRAEPSPTSTPATPVDQEVRTDG